MSAFGIQIDERAICVFRDKVTKHDALTQLTEAVTSTGLVSNSGALAKAILERETVMSTGIGSGVAVPHVRIDAVRRPCMGVGIAPRGIDFGAIDNEPVRVVVLFAMPAGSQKEYLTLLSQVMVAMKTPGFIERLLACSAPKDVAALLNADL